MRKIQDIPEKERPREKMALHGSRVLSDMELLAILLGKGSRKQDVMLLARKILSVIDKNRGVPSLEDLLKIDGVGLAKASVIVAALEFSRRRIRPEGTVIHFSADIIPLLQYYADRKQEHLVCISLNGANEILAMRVVTVGLVNRTQVHPREVFADPITDRATSIILAHNHPSGNLIPSSDDIEVTRKVLKSGAILGITLRDHIIFNKKGYYSFFEQGTLTLEYCEKNSLE